MNENPAPVQEILSGLQVEKTALRLRMTYRWRSGRGGKTQILGEFVFFLIGLASFIFQLLSLAQAGKMTLLQWATTLPFLLAGGFIVYRGLGIFFNTSVFEINANEFISWNGPLPFLGEKNLRLPRGEITRVEWKDVGHSSKQGFTGGHRSSYSATYDVFIGTTQGGNEKILSGLYNRDYAFVVQGELSRFLKLAE